MAAIPKWIEATERFENGRLIITIKKIKWWGWIFVFKLLIQQELKKLIHRQ